MSEAINPANQLWGIYYIDREYARVMGDPLRTVVEAPTKPAVEEAAARLGFGDAWLSRKQRQRSGCQDGSARRQPNDHARSECDREPITKS